MIQELAKRSTEADKHLEILLQVNVSGEEVKHGFEPNLLSDALKTVQSCPHLTVAGLMTMAPAADDPEEARPCFRSLRTLRDELREDPESRRWNLELTELSMGMSGDLEVAIEEGSTLVRVGTDLFGPRPSGIR